MFRNNNKKRWVVNIVLIMWCLVLARPAQAYWPEQCRLLASDGDAGDIFGALVAIDGDYAIVGAFSDDDIASDAGAAYIFKRSSTPNDPNWYEQCKLVSSSPQANGWFSNTVSISENYAIVGAYGENTNGLGDSGIAYIFTPNEVNPNDPNWYEQAKLIPSDATAGDFFGSPVSIDGNYVIIGATGNNSCTGAAYIFKRSDSPGDPNWYEQCKLTASDGQPGDNFRYCSISGDYAIVTAADDDNKTGSAYIFKRSGENWVEQTKLRGSDCVAGDEFGSVGVSINGNYAIVGAYRKDNFTGSAYIFTPNDIDPSNWDQQAKLTASEAEEGDWFGWGVSIDGDYAIVGAPCIYSGGSGLAYVFQRDGENWIERKKLIPSDAENGDQIGMCVSISSPDLIVSGHMNDENGSNSGSAYVFKNICVPAVPDIEVSPLIYDFGDVEIGLSETMIVTISNVGNGGLNVSGIGLETDFAITLAPAAAIVVQPGATEDVEITYTPTVLGYNSAVLKITSNDPDEPVVEVQLSAAAIEIPLPPSEQISNILAFFDTSVDDGSLVGDGPGSSAEKRLNVLRSMVEAAGSLIDDELSEEACQQLLDVYRRMDGQPKPPDFVKGEAVPELAAMIQELMTSLGCE